MSRKRPQKFAAVLRPQTCLIMMMIPQSFPAPEETPESGRSQGEGKERGRADGAGEEVLPFQPERFYDSDRKFSADCGGGERAPPRATARRPSVRPSVDRPTDRTDADADGCCCCCRCVLSPPSHCQLSPSVGPTLVLAGVTTEMD